jgi:PIN domain nuclease of toxin-antitoxin system
VNLLLDAHALLWFLADAPSLSANAKELIEDPTNRKFVSVATCWEIAIKVGLKNSTWVNPPPFDLLGIELRHATFVETLPPHHKDPFDRLLIAQAISEAMPIVSVDAALDLYGATRMW